MKRESIYERRQTADRMEAMMLVVAAVAVAGSLFALLRYGWLPALELLILGSVAFAVSRLFDLIGDLFASIRSLDKKEKVPVLASETGSVESED